MRTMWGPTAAAILGAAVLQVAIAPHLAVAGIVPNVLLLVVLTLAFVEGAGAGLYAGFGAGLTLDLVGSGPVGAWALVLSVTGYAAGLAAANVFAEGWLLPVTVAGLAGLLCESAYAAYLALLGQGAIAPLLLAKALPGALYNTILALLVYPWLARFLRREVRVTEFRRIG